MRVGCSIDGESRFLLHILSEVQDAGHNLVNPHEVIGIKCVNDALLGLSILA
jgi:hypothetical protein